MFYAEVCGEVVLSLKTLDNFSILDSERAGLKLNIKKTIKEQLYKNIKDHGIWPHYLMSSRREGNGTPLQYSCLENPMDGGAWSAAVHGVAESQTRLSDFTFTFHFHALEKEMATHSSVLAGESQGQWSLVGRQTSMGSHRVGHD